MIQFLDPSVHSYLIILGLDCTKYKRLQKITRNGLSGRRNGKCPRVFIAQASFRCREKGDNAIILERINTNTGVITVQLTGQEEVVIFPQSTDILTKCREGTKREVFEKKKKEKKRKCRRESHG